MKLVTIVGPLNEFDGVCLDCVINREFHPEPASGVQKQVKQLVGFDLGSPFSDHLRQVSAVADRLGIAPDFREQPGLDTAPDTISDYLSELDSRIVRLLNEREDNERVISEGGAILNQLTHIKGVNIDLSRFFKVKYVKFRFGYMPRDAYDNFHPLIEDRDDTFFFATGLEKDFAHGFYFVTRESMQKVDQFFASLSFIRSRLSDRVRGDSDSAVRQIIAESDAAKTRIAAIDAELADIKTQNTEKILAYYSYIRLKNDSYNLRRFAAHTEKSFYILGWVPEDKYAEFTANVTATHPECSFGTDAPEKIDDFTPPVKLRNNGLAGAFEPFVSIYGLPAYNELDPTMFFAATYMLLFGIMFGDLGQGFVLALGGALLWHFKRVWLARCAMYMGVSSMAFGAFYGSIFGDEELMGHITGGRWEGWHVLKEGNTSTILQHSIVIGLVVILIVMIFNIVNGIRQRRAEKVAFGQNAVAGGVLYFCLMAVFLPIIGFWIGSDKGNSGIPFIVLGIGILLPFILVFLREPLSKLLEKRPDWKPHSTGEFIVENIFEMIEVLLSYITNTLSFLRVGAYAISHASMMMVVFSLAGAVEGHSGNPAVLIIGNIIIMAMEALLAGIQVLRLEFYEMFSRFYSGSGHAYAPAKVDYAKRAD